MACCSGHKNKLIRLRLTRIIEGFGRLAAERIFGLSPGDLATHRGVICSLCKYHIFLNVLQWGKGFITEGDLPINHNPGVGDVLWCAVCKCCIEAKIRVKEEECPIEEWQDVK